MKQSLLVCYLCLLSFQLKASYGETLLEQLILAEEGDIIEIPKGFHEIGLQLSLTVSHVTLRGQGKDESILSFKNQGSGAEGLKVEANNIVLEGFSILDTKGDAIKISHSQNIIMRNLRVGWTGEISELNGGYGLYPVKSRNILIEGCEAFGASDAGIYVGQSEQIIVRNNLTYNNVAGIEVENSSFADVYGNTSVRNTGGLLVFNLPGLTRLGSHVRVFNNLVYDNNLPNFASPGNVVAHVPQGTGIMVMAYDSVEVFGNKVYAHGTTNLLLTSYFMTTLPVNDPTYKPYVEKINIYANSLGLFDFSIELFLLVLAPQTQVT